MKPHWKVTDIDVELVFDRSLADGDNLADLQHLLQELTPHWSSDLRIRLSADDQRPVDLNDPRSLASQVVGAAGERGATYAALVNQHGVGDERLFGSVEVLGANSELTVVISVDEHIVSSVGGVEDLGNTIAFQIRKPQVEGKVGVEWVRVAFEDLCGRLSPAWGSAYQVSEYWGKVMSDGPTIRAVGRDFGRFLPGVFWLNFFGQRYRDLLGETHLLSSPARRVMKLDDGVLVCLADDPRQWRTQEYVQAEQRLREHLGQKHFFSKESPDLRR